MGTRVSVPLLLRFRAQFIEGRESYVDPRHGIHT